MTRFGTHWAAVAGFLAFHTLSVHAQNIVPGSLSAELKLVATVTPGASGAPTFGVAPPGDPRFMMVGEQGGRIRLLDFSQPNPLLATDFLDLPARVAALPGTPQTFEANGPEKGLLGAAFHPDFNNPANPDGYRKFYTYSSEAYDGGRRTVPVHLQHQTEYPFSPTNPTTYNHQSVIREWTTTAPDVNGVFTVDPAIAPRDVVRIGEPGQFHNAGALQFGHDGYLYISLGDGGGGANNGANDGGNDFNAIQGHTNPGNPDTGNAALGGWTGQGNAQDRRNVYGSILRIKPTADADADTNPGAGPGYRIPKSNPFTSESQVTVPISGWQADWADEIYAYGFRNPFRISFDRATGELYAADVGQDRNTISHEEVNHIVKGGNYGWVVKSGTDFNNRPPGNPTNTFPPPNNVTLIDPIAQYLTTETGPGGLAVIGGFVYRGNLLPGLQGKYIFGDLDQNIGGRGRVLYTDLDDPSLQVFDLGIIGPFAKPNTRLHGVAEDAGGELYFLWENGQITKLVPEPGTAALLLVATLAAWCTRRQMRSAK